MRRWPLPVLAVAAAAASVEMAWGGASLPLGLLLGLATYLVATQLPRRVSIRAGIAVAAALGVALVYATFDASRVPLAAKAVEGFLPLVAAWFVGDSVDRGTSTWRDSPRRQSGSGRLRLSGPAMMYGKRECGSPASCTMSSLTRLR